MPKKADDRNLKVRDLKAKITLVRRFKVNDALAGDILFKKYLSGVQFGREDACDELLEWLAELDV